MKKITFMFVLAAIAATTTASTCSAAIVFIDATETNTARADGSAAAWLSASASGLDNLWFKQVNQGNGNIFESNATTGTSNGEDAPRLVTTISGLVPGESYSILAYFQASIGNNLNTDWRLRAGLVNTVVDLQLFSRADLYGDGATIATEINAGNAPPGAVFTLTGNRILLQASLGMTTADANGEIPVYIDDFAFPTAPPVTNGQKHFLRTWYEGVGYELVPEPNSMLITTIGLVGLGWYGLKRRREVW